MNVGILTFPNSISYGASLQMIALQETVRGFGHEVEVINYHNPYMKAEKHLKKSKHNPLKFEIQKRVRPLLHRRLYRDFAQFEKRFAHAYPVKSFTDKRKLVEIGKRYDAVICGSDQVWCPMITGGDVSYFLDFCTDKTKRVAYAPSFGAESFSEEFYRQIAPELNRFTSLSARELPGKKIVEELTGRDTTLVVDPTFLVEQSHWEQMEKPHPAADQEYVLYFVVAQSEKLFRQCAEFAKQHNLKMVAIGGNAIQARRNTDPMLEYVFDIGPEQWLYLVHHARYVFTNSFHGTAFSVIYQKDFYLQYPAHTGSRLRQVVETLGLEDRVIREGVPLTEEATPYAQAQPIFEQMRANSLTYLENALK